MMKMRPAPAAPPSDRQPQKPPPHHVDGRPWATPYVRRLAHARGIDLSGIANGVPRVRVADLDVLVDTVAADAGAGAVTCSAVLDITGTSADDLVIIAVRAVANLRTSFAGADVVVVRPSSAGPVTSLVDDARLLSRDGIRRALARTVPTAPDRAAAVIHDLTSSRVASAVVEATGHINLAIALGGVVTEPVAVAAHAGLAVALRSRLTMTVTGAGVTLSDVVVVIESITALLDRGMET